jgi:hypothetical protein
LGQKGPDRYAWANKKGGSYDVIDEEKFKIADEPKITLFKAAENIMNNRGSKNQFGLGDGAITPDNFRNNPPLQFSTSGLGVTSEGGGDKAPRRLPLQSFSSYQ